MTAEKYKTRKGVEQFRPVMTTDEASSELMDSTQGFCLACGAEASGVEPDARKCTCEACGMSKVYGLQELLLMNLLKTRDDEEER